MEWHPIGQHPKRQPPIEQTYAEQTPLRTPPVGKPCANYAQLNRLDGDSGSGVYAMTQTSCAF